MASRKLFLLPGDGIGPETMGEVRKLIAMMNAEMNAGFEIDEGLVGGSAYDAHGQSISEADMEKALAADAVRSGALGGPTLDGIGVAGEGPHTHGACLEIDTLAARSELLRRLILRLSEQPSRDLPFRRAASQARDSL